MAPDLAMALGTLALLGPACSGPAEGLSDTARHRPGFGGRAVHRTGLYGPHVGGPLIAAGVFLVLGVFAAHQ